jgi:cytochrome oxidase assembly protein ShyY1
MRVLPLMASWRLRAPWWAVFGVIAGVGLFCILGVWQIHRGQAKQALIDQFAHIATAPARALDLRTISSSEIQRVVVSGRYDASHQMFLDNQAYQQRPGYRVWTPLRIESGELILVNRGWVPQTRSREALPQLSVPEGVQALTGYWVPLPRAGLQLEQGQCTKPEHFPVILNFPDATRIACVLGEPVADGQLLLDNAAANGFIREWTFDNGFPPTRHYGYAFQWFALAATLIVIFLKLNLKRDTKHE